MTDILFDLEDKEVIANIISSYTNGMSLTQLEVKFNHNRSTLHRLLIKRNVPRRKAQPRPWALSKSQIDEAICLYQKGYNFTEIAHRFKVTDVTVAHFLKLKNIKNRWGTIGRGVIYKENAIVLLGQKCVFCGETNSAFLNFDHINGGGRKIRHYSNSGDTGGINTARHIMQLYKHDKHPEQVFQLLCYNCNWIKYLKDSNSIIANISFIQDNDVYNLSYHQRVRYYVLHHYSNGAMACKCCSNNDFRVLTLDHINGGGTQLFQNYGSSIFYRSLYNENFPSQFDSELVVLCRNCNRSVLHKDGCPHNNK